MAGGDDAVIRVAPEVQGAGPGQEVFRAVGSDRADPGEIAGGRIEPRACAGVVAAGHIGGLLAVRQAVAVSVGPERVRAVEDALGRVAEPVPVRIRIRVQGPDRLDGARRTGLLAVMLGLEQVGQPVRIGVRIDRMGTPHRFRPVVETVPVRIGVRQQRGQDPAPGFVRVVQPVAVGIPGERVCPVRFHLVAIFQLVPVRVL